MGRKFLIEFGDSVTPAEIEDFKYFQEVVCGWETGEISTMEYPIIRSVTAYEIIESAAEEASDET